MGSRAVSGGGDMAHAHRLVSLKRQRRVQGSSSGLAVLARRRAALAVELGPPGGGLGGISGRSVGSPSSGVDGLGLVADGVPLVPAAFAVGGEGGVVEGPAVEGMVGAAQVVGEAVVGAAEVLLSLGVGPVPPSLTASQHMMETGFVLLRGVV